MKAEIVVRYLGIVAIAAFLSACSGMKFHQDGIKLMEEGKYEEAVSQLEAASKKEPDNMEYRLDLTNKRREMVTRLLTSADSARASGRLDEADTNYRRTLVVDRNSERAKEGLRAIEQDRRHHEIIEKAAALYKKGEIEEALEKLKPVIMANPNNPELLSLKRAIEEQMFRADLSDPTLKSIYRKPLTLEFKEANLKMVFEVLSRTTGINFILDPEVRSDLRTSLFMKQSTLEDVVDYLLTTNQLEKKVLNQSSVLIFPNNSAKAKSYQDLIVKAFYLANADVKQSMNMVKTLLKTREIYVDEKLNMMVMRDTPETIRLAEKLIAVQDIAEPEVMLEVEILEIKRSKLMDLGINFPNQMTLSPLPTTGSSLTLNALKSINDNSIGVAMPNTVLNLKKVDGLVNILANPRIRARNREKAKIMIGDRVPVITTTSVATGFVSENISYVDVGLKLDVEPSVHLHGDVSIKIGMEVSSIVQQIKTSTGSLAYQIGNRSASTLLQLKDGETQVLAGLINNEERGTANKIPGLGDLPVAGRLFSEHNTDDQKTEIVLSITPHVVRNLQRRDAADEEFWSGSETNVRTKPLTLQPMKQPVPVAKAVMPSPDAKPDSVVQSAAAATQAGLTLDWQGPTKVNAGDVFSVALRVKSGVELRSFLFQLGYDPASLEVVKVSEGNLFKQNKADTNFNNNVDKNNGKITGGVAHSDPNAAGVKGEDSVVQITFKALAATAQSNLRVLAITPVGTGDMAPVAALPNAYALVVN